MPAKNRAVFHVYILKCAEGAYYVGQTAHILSRLMKHFSNRGADLTKARPPVALVYLEVVPSREVALFREGELVRHLRKRSFECELVPCANDLIEYVKRLGMIPWPRPLEPLIGGPAKRIAQFARECADRRLALQGTPEIWAPPVFLPVHDCAFASMGGVPPGVPHRSRKVRWKFQIPPSLAVAATM